MKRNQLKLFQRRQLMILIQVYFISCISGNNSHSYFCNGCSSGGLLDCVSKYLVRLEYLATAAKFSRYEVVMLRICVIENWVWMRENSKGNNFM